MRILWSEPVLPKLGPIPRISPSRVLNEESCIVREAWSALRRDYSLPPHPSAILGRLSHELIQATLAAKLSSPEETKIQNQWTILEQDLETRLSTKWPDRVLLPLCDSAHDYEVRRRRAVNAAKAIWRSSKSYQGDAATGFGSEVWVESRDKLIGGFIDFVSGSGSDIHLWDFKSGMIYDTQEDNRIPQLKHEYTRQMELYCALYNESFGRWPSKYIVSQVQGQRVEVNVERGNCDMAIAEARNSLEAVNKRLRSSVADGSQVRRIEELASPSVEQCKWCLYRASCVAYWKTRKTQPSAGWPRDFLETILDARILGNGNLQVSVREQQDGTPLRIHIRPDAFKSTEITQAMRGKRIWANNLKSTSANNSYTMGVTSVFYVA